MTTDTHGTPGNYVVKRYYKANGTKQKRLKSATNKAKKFFIGVHTQEITDSSPVVFARKGSAIERFWNLFLLFSQEKLSEVFDVPQKINRTTRIRHFSKRSRVSAVLRFFLFCAGDGLPQCVHCGVIVYSGQHLHVTVPQQSCDRQRRNALGDLECGSGVTEFMRG